MIQEPQDQQKTEERHDDFGLLNQTINNVIASGVTKVLWGVLPLMVAGVVALIAGYFEAKSTKAEVEKLNVRMESTNEKVLTMWYGGNWAGDKHEDKK